MKKRYLLLTAMLLSTIIYSCKKNAIQLIDQKVDASTTAQIKFFNFSVNAPSINFYANGIKVSGVSSATGIESTTGTSYSSVFPASNYELQPAGTYTFTGQIPSSATTDPNLAVLTLPGALANGKYYSVYASGFYNITAKTADAFIVEDKIPDIDYTVAYVRFVNTISNLSSTSPLNGTLSLYVKNTTTLTETLAGTSIPYKGASDFVAVPSGIYELYARYPSAPTVNVISRNAAITGTVSFVGGRVYTISSRGDITVTSTTATNRPYLDNTANR